MSILRSPNLLRHALIADAIGSGASAVLLLSAAGMLAPLLGLPEQLLRTAGLILVPFVALVAFAALRGQPAAAWAVILINFAWVIGSVLLLVGDSVAPTTLGYAFVIAQAAFVAVVADLQYFGLRAARPLAT